MIDRDGDVGEPAVTLDFVESGFLSEHPGGGLPQVHLSAAPVFSVAVDDPGPWRSSTGPGWSTGAWLELAGDPEPGHGRCLFDAFAGRGGAGGMRMVEFDRQGIELLERAVVVGLLPRPPEPHLDGLAVALGEMVEHVAFLVLHAALNWDVVAEHRADRFPQRVSIRQSRTAAPVRRRGHGRRGRPAARRRRSRSRSTRPTGRVRGSRPRSRSAMSVRTCSSIASSIISDQVRAPGPRGLPRHHRPSPPACEQLGVMFLRAMMIARVIGARQDGRM
jgi:hypothetical protein